MIKRTEVECMGNHKKDSKGQEIPTDTPLNPEMALEILKTDSIGKEEGEEWNERKE